MPSPVIIDFILRGMPAVMNAMRSVEQATVAADRAATRTSQAGAKTRVSHADKEAKEKVAILLKADRLQRAAQDNAIKDTARAAKAKLREISAASKQEQRIAESVAKNIASIRERSATMAGRLAAKQARDEIRSAEEAARNIHRIKERSATMAGQLAAKQARDEKRVADRTKHINETQDRRSKEHFARGVGGAVVTGAGAGARRVAGLTQQTAGIVGQLGGGFSIADAVQQQQALNKQAVTMSNAAFRGNKGEKRIDPKAVLEGAKVASAQTGLDPSDLITAAHSFGSKTGDYGQGMKLMQTFGDVAQASGASVEDVANTAGILRVQNAKLDDKGMKQLLLGTIRQGQEGSVEFGDLARVAGKITKSSASYAGSQADTQSKLLGLAQIGMRTGALTEQGTTVSNIAMDASKNQKALKQKLGPEAFNAKGQIAMAPDEFIASIMASAGGNLTTLQAGTKSGGFGFGSRSMKMFQALAPTYNEAEADALKQGKSQKEATAIAKDAVLKDIRKVSAGSMSEDTVKANVAMAKDAQKVDIAMRDLRLTVGEQLLPEFIKLVPTIKEMTPALVDLLKTGVPAFTDLIKTLAEFASKNKDIIHDLAAHPIGTIIAFEVTKSIGSAAIGEGIKAVLTKIIASASPGGGGAGAGGVGAGGSPGATTAIVAAGALQAVALKGNIEAMSAGQQGGAFRAGQLESDIAGGGEKGKAAEAEVAKAKQEYGGIKGLFKIYTAGVASAPESVYSGVTGEKNTSREALQKAFSARELVDNEGIQAALTKAVDAGAREGMKRAAAAQGSNGGDPGAGRPPAASQGIVTRTQ